MAFSQQINDIPATEQKYWAETPVTNVSTEQAWELYLASYRSGNWLSALQTINYLIAQSPQIADYWRIKAKLHGTLGHTVCCFRSIELLLDLAPFDLEGLRMKALYHYCHHEHQQALDICFAVLDKDKQQQEFRQLQTAIMNSMAKAAA